MEFETDFLIIGSGIAGLMFALKVAEFGDVALVTKKKIMDSNTAQAQGGIASVFDKVDSFDLHICDTLASGDGLSNKEVVEMVVKNGPDRILELINFGVHFNLKGKSSKKKLDFDLGREGGHSKKRIMHAQDMTGLEIETVLVR
ncbi:MAG: FAD-binding protein, partial [Desulfobacterales bacterium]|nr:FAD-binding protein [Desulfobacterales bacterium]